MTPLHRRGVTASKTGLLLACQYWAREDVERRPDPENDAMARGTRVHEAIDDYVTSSTVRDLIEEERAMVRAAMVYLMDSGAARAIDDGNGRSEYTFGSDLLGHYRHFAGESARAYPETDPGFFWGTADIAVFQPQTIVDWKTGPTSAAGALPQLLTLAVLAGLEGARLVSVELREDGFYVTAIDTTVDVFDLAEHEAALRDAIAAIPGAIPTPGAHCTEEYCPARMTCPARTAPVEAAATALVPVDALVRRGYDPRAAVSAETVAEHAVVIDVLGDWVEAKKREVTAYVLENGAVDLGPYGTASMVNGRRINGKYKPDALAKLAAAKGASDEEIEACRSEPSMGSPYMQIRTKKTTAAAKQRTKKAG
jgi:hypothetical protein